MDKVKMLYEDKIDGTIQTRMGLKIEEIGSYTILTDRSGIKHQIPTSQVIRIEQYDGEDYGQKY